jgi:hypothetical protein
MEKAMNNSSYGNLRPATIAAAMILTLGNAGRTEAGDYEWVKPNAYTFGICGGVGGDSVPGLLNKKYFTQYSCRDALDPRDCYTQAKSYERHFNENKTASCGAWLRQELTNCERYVEREARVCDNLAR